MTKPDGSSGDARDKAIRAAIQLAVRAPSLHNCQPWLWRADQSTVQLYLDQSRHLPATDPDDRELIISCGAALHHLLVALASLGCAARVRRVPDPGRPSLLAEVVIVPGTPADIEADLAAVILDRRTDRRAFNSWPVPAEYLGRLRELAAVKGGSLQPIEDPDQRWKLYRTITAAAEWQAADPVQVAELATWSGRGAEMVDGVPAANSPVSGRVAGQPPMRAFSGSGPARAPVSAEPECAALLLLSTPADTPLYWLRAGELTSAVLLTATRDGLASSALTQPFEVPATRRFLREQVTRASAPFPQVLLRIGWLPPGAPPLPATPRRALSEVLAPLGDWTQI